MGEIGGGDKEYIFAMNPKQCIELLYHCIVYLKLTL